MTSRLVSRLGRLAGLVLAGAVLGGCFNPFSPPVQGTGTSEPPPVANSAVNVLKRLEWAYRHRDISVYRELFTDDYRFVFSALDTNGNAYRDVPFTREDDLTSTTNLFQGGHATEPAATEIRLDFDKNLRNFPDPRPGKDPGWHRNIRTTVQLTISTSDNNQTSVVGRANFFLVRGDSAKIPDDLQGRFDDLAAFWFIERWEDETDPGIGGGAPNAVRPSPPAAGAAADSRTTGVAPAGASTANPYRFLTWGAIKRRFAEPAAGAR